MLNVKIPKSLIGLMLISIVVACFYLVPVAANNHGDERYEFTLSGAGNQFNTDYRKKYDKTSSWMNCEYSSGGTSRQYYVQPYAKYQNQYGNVISKDVNVTVKTYYFYSGTKSYVLNYTWEHAPSGTATAYEKLHCWTGWYDSIYAYGVWSPDSI